MVEQLVEHIYEKNPRQKKKLQKFFGDVPQAKKELDDFLKAYAPYLDRQSISMSALGDAYLGMVEHMTVSRIHFMKTGCYPTKSQLDCIEAVYDNPSVMRGYMLGLAVSQFLWQHHYELFCFYRKALTQVPQIRNLLEVGCGHGLFLLEATSTLASFERFDVIDVSETSIQMTRGILASIKPELEKRVQFLKGDISCHQPDKQYDFITMGEVLEHVDSPKEVLMGLHRCLSDEGALFLSTCINCPAIDHVSHFKSTEEVRQLFHAAGFTIESEHVAPSEALPQEKLVEYQVDVSYAAILRKF